MRAIGRRGLGAVDTWTLLRFGNSWQFLAMPLSFFCDSRPQIFAPTWLKFIRKLSSAGPAIG